MRAFLVFAVLAGLGFLYLRQKQHQPPTEAGAKAPPAQAAAAAPQLTPAPRGVASEHNWMKRSLDRARDVADQSRAQTQASQNP
jgi:hypothetical protein